MSRLCLVYLIPVVLVTCSQHTKVFATQFQDPGNASYFRNFPCPNAEDIDPCLCTYQEDEGVMDMDCYGIADEHQLYNVFHADIPVPTFRVLRIATFHMKTLSDDTVFGDATFEEVYIRDGTLSSVDPKIFMNSASTLSLLNLNYNDISDFTFETLSQYTQLKDFSLSGNPISSFPIIQSETLTSLDLGESLYDTIPTGAMDGLPNLERFYADETKLDSMATGLFTSLPNIEEIIMSYTGLIHLESQQFAVNSNVISYIALMGNEIATVDAEAFKGVQSGTIDLFSNQLTLLPEATWRPVMEAGVKLRLADNTLTCGCDVAWLVLEQNYHELVEDAQCHSGEMLVDLDPSDFENCTD